MALLLQLPGWGQSISGISGRVVDTHGAAVAGAQVRVEKALTGLRRETETQADGTFVVEALPLGSYVVAVEKGGFARAVKSLMLRSTVPAAVEFALVPASASESVDVSAGGTFTALDPTATGTRTALDRSVISKMPVAAGARGLEAVLVSFPGFAANANGAIHPRGAHNQMTFVVDGMAISDQLTGAFANPVDPGIVQNLELYTGNIPAEFGSKISGVANVTTRTGSGMGRSFGGSVELRGASDATLGGDVQLAGERGASGYFLSVAGMKSNRFLDQVSRDNLHNGGNLERTFARVDLQPSSADALRVMVMAGRSSFELANLRSQQANGQDQRQLLRDASVSVAWTRTLSPAAMWESQASYRTTVAQLRPSAGDTPVTAAQARHLSTLALGSRFNLTAGRHAIRAGFDVQHFPVSEDFSFGITDRAFNDPASADFIPTLANFDLSRGGRLFRFRGKASGRQASGFVQDNVNWGALNVSLGLRYDAYRFLVNGNQVQPRVGVSYHFARTGTVLRASYNRNYHTPVNENLLLSNSDESAALVLPSVRETVGGAVIRIRPERQNAYEAGIQQTIGRRISLDASFYHKDSDDLHDNDNFFNTGIIFPTALKRSRMNGVDARVSLLPARGFSGWVSMTHYHVVVTPPFTGGLFLGSTAIDLLAAGPFVIDHDQRLGLHGMLQHTTRWGWWSSLSIRYDSGLVANPSDPVEVAADPDYADLLPYVDLRGDPARVRPRTITDVAVGYERVLRDRRRWGAQIQATNLFDRTALYNFQSIFVGTRLVAPRTVGVKLRYSW